MSKSQMMGERQIAALIDTIVHKPEHRQDYCRIFFPMKFPGFNKTPPQISFVFRAREVMFDMFEWEFFEVEILKVATKVTK